MDDKPENLHFGKGRRICAVCTHPKKLEEFRQRSTVCRKCFRNLAQTEGALQGKSEKAALTTLVKKLQSEKAGTPYAHEVMSALSEKMGGIRGLTNMWHDAILEASPNVQVKHYYELMRMLLKIDQRTHTLDMGKLSDSELESELKELALSVLQERPEALQQILKYHGMTVVRDADVMEGVGASE